MERRLEVTGESVLNEQEPGVADLVANLRARCDHKFRYNALDDGLVFPDPDGERVVLPVDLVLAIADGIEATSTATLFTVRSPGGGADEEVQLVERLAKDIVKLVVTKLFAPTKEEAERARDACETLGLDDEDITASVEGSKLPIWLGMLGILPALFGGLGLGRRKISK